jgi:glycosyltransferase involved in cell wall biosynthesis
MAQAFAELGHDVLLVGPNASPAGAPSTDRLVGRPPAFRSMTMATGLRRGQSFVHALRLARLIRRERIAFHLSRNLRGCLIPALRGVPTVFESHTAAALRSRQDRWVLRRLVRAPGFRGIVAISGALANDLVEEFALDPGTILVAHDAVRPAKALPVTPSVPAAPEDGTAGDRPLAVTYTGSLYPGKGADLLLALAARCGWARFTIAGGPLGHADELRRRALADGLDNVTVAGPLSPDDARAAQAASDVLIAPFANRVESDSGVDIARWTSPLKVFEYMASGRPMVVGDLPVLREVLRPNVDALMPTLDDVDAFHAALVRLRDEPALRERLARSARERVLAHHTWERRARAILGRFGPTDRVGSVTIVLASLAAGGAERVAVNLAAGLTAAGRRVRLLVVDGSGPLRASLPADVIVEDLRRRRVRQGLPGILRSLWRHHPDVVLTTQTHVSLAVLAGLRATAHLRATGRGRKNPRTVVREPLLRTGPVADDRQQRWSRRWFPSASLLVASSAAMAANLERLVGPGGPPVLELANPVDIALLRDAATSGASLLSDADGAVQLVVVARLVPQKGHADLLDAFAWSDRDDLRLTVVGDGPLRAGLEAQAQQLGLNSAVRFVGAIEDRSVLLSTVAAADLLVQPSTVEGMPNAVLEALAVGTPVLATTDLKVLAELAAEVGPDALRLVPRTNLAQALAALPPGGERNAGPSVRSSLLPARFSRDRAVAALLAALEGDYSASGA